eukprot:CAMPEP_0170919710 /NCGR_PEP_ID=MMETSP0735-20130129/8749_1 /TAXON_ID=186038 /ORGANISM="Fragilariopsis kerguelensis, Strain L26-C5" /LENGTH=79 /DNA_ID=CAMNT_0011318449 /DNA_START=300 /DNA_END=536 /DNA_ORIENTATION=-
MPNQLVFQRRSARLFVNRKQATASSRVSRASSMFGIGPQDKHNREMGSILDKLLLKAIDLSAFNNRLGKSETVLHPFAA